MRQPSSNPEKARDINVRAQAVKGGLPRNYGSIFDAFYILCEGILLGLLWTAFINVRTLAGATLLEGMGNMYEKLHCIGLRTSRSTCGHIYH